MRLDGQIAVVTGGSRGIGRAIARAFAIEGASVALLSTTESGAHAAAEEIAAERGAIVRGYGCDLTDEAAVRTTFTRIIEDFGTIDILINNAGITEDGLMLRMSTDSFDRVIGVNLRGTFLCTRAVYPILMKKRQGRIINIASVAGIMGNAGQTNYAAAKAGILGLTKSVAKELAPRGITCNAIAPGFVETDMTANLAKDSSLSQSIPLQRFGRPEEIAAATVFLASREAGYITGEVLRIDGGLAM